jgi:CBS domain containing-hemolysin-like protein
MTAMIFLLMCVLFGSGLCSMVEAAILSLSLVRARILFDQKRKGSKDLLFVKENINASIATIVILNNAINIIGAIFVGRQALRLFGSQWLGVSSAALTFLIIVVSEVIPKTIGEHYRVSVSLSSAKILRAVVWTLAPVTRVLMMAANLFKSKKLVPKVTEDEIKIMLKLGRDAGTVEVDEEDLCNKVFKLNDIKAFNIMKSMDKIFALASGQKLSEVKEAVLNSRYSRIAVYDKDISNIIGISQQRVLLREIARDNYDAKVGDFVSRPIFVSENEKADSLLNKFQAYHQHLFIVRDKSGKNIGIISMEDVLEELFGEIYDEKDKIT